MFFISQKQILQQGFGYTYLESDGRKHDEGGKWDRKWYIVPMQVMAWATGLTTTVDPPKTAEHTWNSPNKGQGGGSIYPSISTHYRFKFALRALTPQAERCLREEVIGGKQIVYPSMADLQGCLQSHLLISFSSLSKLTVLVYLEH